MVLKEYRKLSDLLQHCIDAYYFVDQQQYSEYQIDLISGPEHLAIVDEDAWLLENDLRGMPDLSVINLIGCLLVVSGYPPQYDFPTYLCSPLQLDQINFITNLCYGDLDNLPLISTEVNKSLKEYYDYNCTPVITSEVTSNTQIIDENDIVINNLTKLLYFLQASGL